MPKRANGPVSVPMDEEDVTEVVMLIVALAIAFVVSVAEVGDTWHVE